MFKQFFQHFFHEKKFSSVDKIRQKQTDICPAKTERVFENKSSQIRIKICRVIVELIFVNNLQQIFVQNFVRIFQIL